LEMGGSDQLFNNMVGRELQKNEGKEGQLVIVTPLLVGTDGHIKMSKSKGNYIAVTDPPSGATGIFGKVMSIPDRLMESYFQLLTDLPMDEVRRQIADHPRDAKIRLAKHLISWLHDQQAADAAEAEFITQFVNKKAPDEMPEFQVGPGPQKLAPLLVQAGLASSNGEAMRKIKEGAVSIEGEKVTDPQKQWTFDHPVAVRLGRRYARLKP
ncbi:MAG TPA: tyrosine--tRNA ligase, partial [Tepidisphaeraceae bacterium]|nr:tyrosine--tRNA ligase [Tepidisphaeraceae bacterium]